MYHFYSATQIYIIRLYSCNFSVIIMLALDFGICREQKKKKKINPDCIFMVNNHSNTIYKKTREPIFLFNLFPCICVWMWFTFLLIFFVFSANFPILSQSDCFKLVHSHQAICIVPELYYYYYYCEKKNNNNNWMWT